MGSCSKKPAFEKFVDHPRSQRIFLHTLSERGGTKDRMSVFLIERVSETH